MSDIAPYYYRNLIRESTDIIKVTDPIIHYELINDKVRCPLIYKEDLIDVFGKNQSYLNKCSLLLKGLKKDSNSQKKIEDLISRHSAISLSLKDKILNFNKFD